MFRGGFKPSPAITALTPSRGDLICGEGRYQEGNPEKRAAIFEKDGWMRVKVNGVDVFKPQTREVVSDGADGIACWFVDTDYNEESFFVRQAYFLGANDPYNALTTTLMAEIDADAWATLHSDTSRRSPSRSRAGSR